MKVSLRLSLLVLAATAQASSKDASIFTFDSNHASPPRDAPTLDPEAIRLLLSQRLGVSEYHQLNGVDESVLQHLDTYGGRGYSLLRSNGQDDAAGKLVLLVDGVDRIEDVAALRKRKSSLVMSNPPVAKANEDLARAFSRQLSNHAGAAKCVEEVSQEGVYFGQVSHKATHRGQCCDILSSLSTPKSSHATSKPNEADLRPISNLIRLSPKTWCGESVSSLVYLSPPKNSGSTKGAYKETMAFLSGVVKELDELAKSGAQESLVMLIPSSASHGKRSANPYGDMPSTTRLKPRQHVPSEEPLEVTTAAEPSHTSSSHPLLLLEDGPAPPKGSIIPVCHVNYKACVAATNNCTGHGSCFKKYQAAPGKDGDNGKACYACGCTPSIVETGGSKKTIRWGGSACQKKDVSSSFFLLAGMTVFLAGAVAWGIGLLYTIGQEELPGVIGAGVAGPKAR